MVCQPSLVAGVYAVGLPNYVPYFEWNGPKAQPTSRRSQASVSSSTATSSQACASRSGPL